MPRRRVNARLRAWRWMDALYDVRILLLRGSWPQAERYLIREFGLAPGDIGESSGAKTALLHSGPGAVVVVWVPASINPRLARDLGTLAHEAYHAACFVLRDRGCPTVEQVDEPVAYYIGWIVERILTCLQAR